MDPSLKCFSFHKVSKKLKVRIGSIQEELNLVVKIDKGLVHLPGQVRKYRRHKESKRKKVERRKEQSCDGFNFPTERYKKSLSRIRYDNYNLITKPVDSTLLVNLASYANFPVKKTGKREVPLLQIRKSSDRVPVLQVMRQENQPSFGEKESFYNLFEERESSDKSFKVADNTVVEQKSVNTWPEGGRPAFKDFVSVPSASMSTMDCRIGNSHLDESQSFCKETKHQQLQNVANSIRNNNEVKIGNDVCHIKNLPNGEKEMKSDSEQFKLSTDLQHPRRNTQMPLENGDNQQFSQRVTLPLVCERGLNDDHFDQTVPQSPQNDNNHGSEPLENRDSIVHEESQIMNHNTEFVQETNVQEKLQSSEETNHDRNREIIKDQQADEMPTLEPQDLHSSNGGYHPDRNRVIKDETLNLEKEEKDTKDEAKPLLSSERSIGERVDAEIKALLTNDMGDVLSSEDSTESSNIPPLEHVYSNSDSWENTQLICKVEEAGMDEGKLGIKAESGICEKEGDHIIRNENQDAAMHFEAKERDENVKTEHEESEMKCEKMEGMLLEKNSESQEGQMLVGLKEEKPDLTKVSDSNEELQRSDYEEVECNKNRVVKKEDKALESASELLKSEKLPLTENRNSLSSASNMSENAQESVHPDLCSENDPIKQPSDNSHPTGKNPVAQTVEDSLSNPVIESPADYSQCPQESLNECQVGRKGLKQLQSLSQYEAEVTSKQEDITSPPPASSSLSSEKSSTSASAESCLSEARSQSVIVSNPISLSHHLNKHGIIKSEQPESSAGVSDAETKGEAESNPLEENETGLNTSVTNDRLGNVPTGETHPKKERSSPVERSELFQALTPPPPSYTVTRSLKRQVSAPMSSKNPGETFPVDEETGIQITSVRTLAPLTNKGKPSSLSTAVENLKARHAAMLQQGSMSKDTEEPVHTIINERRRLDHNVVLQGPPVASLQATENGMISSRSIREPQMHTPNLVDLSKGGSLQHVGAMGNTDNKERMVMMMPKSADGRTPTKVPGYPTMVPNRTHGLSYCTLSKEVERPPVPLSEYNPEEQQQHFLEIKRHLLNSNMAGRTKDVVSVPKVVPMAISGPNTRPVISVAPVTQSENRVMAVDERKIDSPLGKFSGAMMEHVKHWKEQNEKTNQSQPILSPVKVTPNPVPLVPSNQPLLYSPVVPPAHISPTIAMDHANNLTKDEKPVDAQAAEANRGLLENLQAIHKMYFKTMQGGDKIVFPRMPSKKPVAAPPEPMSDMVQVVKPFMPPVQPHLIPRFPPNGQVPPELLHYPVNVVGRNFPPPSQMSLPGQENFSPGLIPRMPVSSAAERHQFKFHDMNARFPRPFPVVQLEQVKTNQVSNSEMVVMHPAHPNQFQLSPQTYIGLKQNSVPHVKQEIISPTSSQGMPILVSPSGTKFIPGINITNRQKELVGTGTKRKSDDAAPLDLTTGPAKVRRYQEDNEHSADQPMDLSTKTKSAGENLHEKDLSLVQKVPVLDRPQPSGTGVVSYQGILPPQSVNTMTKNGTAAKTLPEHLLSRYHGQQFGPNSMQMTPSTVPPGMGLPVMHYSNAQMVLPHMALSPNSRHPQPTPVDGSNQHLTQQLSSPGLLAQKRMPTPDQVEILKLVSGKTGQMLPHGMVPLNKSTNVAPAGAFPANVMSYTPVSNIPQRENLVQVQQMSEVHAEVPVKRKRGRPKGSGNKNRRAALIANQFMIQQPSEPVNTSASSDIAECQFCDFKAASRGDVRQHVKAVHFAKFRRDSNKSLGGCDMMTPTSEYAVSVGHPMESVNAEPSTGQWTTVSGQNAVGQDHLSQTQGVQSDSRVSPFTASLDSALVIDVPAEAESAITGEQGEQNGVQEEANFQGETSQMSSDSSQEVNSQSNQVLPKASSDGERQDKPPLKITLRRISSTSGTSGDKTPMVFSPLPQDKGPPEKKAKFVCQKCGASYNYINGLREHESRHRVDLPFECGVCHLKYKTQGMLSRHQAQKNHLPNQ